ncbi:HAMP domain-containing histidine kinase [Tolypothrix sp. FACHB-123]|uniref:sensor histidine kinase n=1 Tax=Tolypothrix sp. FACHB-123 TaxID=2692868 RepID=UPI001685595F|nr:HAMP domain-containing sensor histidine kinase [Tolypothrix sp. FACHB-123]MBD2358141.1 HAMP domain-containing histidine kinase [Tolypothrix sp. FACHB-123]
MFPIYKFFEKYLVLRFLSIHIVAYILSVAGCFVSYKGYWQTIFTIQTVDFNIISHILPTKISILLSQKSKEELQKTIDSNYGLFGIVVTDCSLSSKDCSSQKILYYSSRFFKKEPQIDTLDISPYDLLKDPPPILAESYYPKLFLNKREKTNKNNLGRIIGRVYYIRGNQPSFLDEYIKFIKKPLRLGFRSVVYGQTTILFLILGVLSWGIIEYQLKISKQKYNLLKAQVELDRINTLNETFSHVIESEFSSRVTNNLQQLDFAIKGIISRLRSDTINIIHDIQKAPLLSNTDDFDEILASYSKEHNDSNLLGLLRDANDSIKTIDFVVKELRELTDLEEQSMVVQSELHNLKENLSPTITKRTKIEFDLTESPISIICNPWRFRSIIRNAIYNSSAALNKHSRNTKIIDFQPKIFIKCYVESKLAIIEIIDNGPGIPLDILPKLYESHERLNKSAGELRGNGSLIVTAYLKFHNGKVRKMNHEEGGASVAFLFPISGD